MLLTWPQYYQLNKDTMSMTEMVRQYNLLSEIEHMSDVVTDYLLQENLDYLLQEDGSRIFWK